MQINRPGLIWIGIFLFLFIAGLISGYFYFLTRQKAPAYEIIQRKGESPQDTDLSIVRVYYPVKERLIMEERRVRRQPSTASMAGSVVEEFLKGPSIDRDSLVPEGVRLLNTFVGKDGILYVDLSDEMRRNFQGDALAELLLLKGLYESVISNIAGIEDIKILIEGKEIESLGGHISILYPLKNTVTIIMNKDQEWMIGR